MGAVLMAVVGWIGGSGGINWWQQWDVLVAAVGCIGGSGGMNWWQPCCIDLMTSSLILKDLVDQHSHQVMTYLLNLTTAHQTEVFHREKFRFYELSTLIFLSIKYTFCVKNFKRWFEVRWFGVFSHFQPYLVIFSGQFPQLEKQIAPGREAATFR